MCSFKENFTLNLDREKIILLILFPINMILEELIKNIYDLKLKIIVAKFCFQILLCIPNGKRIWFWYETAPADASKLRIRKQSHISHIVWTD